MPIPVLTFFNNKGGVGKTSLVYHLSWMLYDLGYRVLACDLDPQANLTAAFADVGPNLGAINRSALIASDYVVVPLGADLFSLRGLRNLGPTLKRWRDDWQRRRTNWNDPAFPLPKGNMEPIGYIMQQHGVRLERPIKAYDKWVNRMPEAYARNLVGNKTGTYVVTPEEDPENSLATLKHYRSLIPMAQEKRKPIFHLTTADGAFGSHAAAVNDARGDFKILAQKIVSKIGIEKV